MDAEPLPVPIEDLLAHAGWVRSLARSLVSDPAAADDLVQETWLAALRRPPATDDNLRGWLARVVRNFARQRARGEAARTVREAEPRSETTPTPGELVERMDAQRVLAEEIVRIEEPLRETLLLRYYEDLSAADIARRTGTPAGTVRWRLKRGLEELRARLDLRSGGDRRAWMAALVPWIGGESAAIPVAASPGVSVPPGASGTSVPLGASASAASTPHGLTALLSSFLAMNLSLKIAIGALALSGIVLGLRSWRVGPLPDDVVVLAEDPAPTVATAPPGPRAEPAAPLRSAVEPNAGGPGAGQAATSGTSHADAITVRLTVTDTAGEPVPGAYVSIGRSGRSMDDPSLPRTDARGRLEAAQELPISPYQLDVRIAADGYATASCTAVARRGEDTDLGTIALEPGATVTGRVVTQGGRPVAGAHIDLTEGRPDTSDDERRRRTPHPEGDWKTDAEGRFRAAGLPVGRVHLWASADDLQAAPSGLLDLTAGETREVELELGPWPADETLTGIVLDPDGQPVPWAPVVISYRTLFSNGMSSTASRADGRFRRLVDPKRRFEIRARVPNTIDADWTEAVAHDMRAGRGDVTLRFGRPQRVELLVTGPDGGPLETYDVTVRPTDDDARPRTEAFAGAGPVDLAVPTERFEILVSAPLCEERELGPFRPDRLPPRIECQLAAVGGVRGRVVTAAGEPVAGARVILKRSARQKVLVNGLPVLVDPGAVTEEATDADGSFALTLRESGDFVLFTEAPGWARTAWGPFHAKPGPGIEVPDLVLCAGGAIEGRVIVAPDEVPTGTIVAVSRGDGFARTQRVGPDGRFRFGGLTPGAWLVKDVESEIREGYSSSYSSGFGPWETLPSSCLVTDGETTFFDLDLSAGGRCRVRIAVAIDGEPPAEGEARLVPGWIELAAPIPAETGPQRSLAADGTATLGVDEPGTWHLTVTLLPQDGLYWTFVDELALEPGEVPWTLEYETGTLELRGLPPVTAPYGYFVAWERGNVFGLREIGRDEQGSYRVEQAPAGGRLRIVEPGAYDLEQHPRFWPTLAEIELAPGATEVLTLE